MVGGLCIGGGQPVGLCIGGGWRLRLGISVGAGSAVENRCRRLGLWSAVGVGANGGGDGGSVGPVEGSGGMGEPRDGVRDISEGGRGEAGGEVVRRASESACLVSAES